MLYATITHIIVYLHLDIEIISRLANIKWLESEGKKLDSEKQFVVLSLHELVWFELADEAVLSSLRFLSIEVSLLRMDS